MGTGEFKRKLTAVLSADVAGYSWLMGEDEAATIKTLGARMGTGIKICVSSDRCSVRVHLSIPKKCQIRSALTSHPPNDIVRSL